MTVEVEYFVSFQPRCDLVLVEAGVNQQLGYPLDMYDLKHHCDLALLVSSVSQLRSSSMSATLLVFRYLFVAYLAAPL